MKRPLASNWVWGCTPLIPAPGRLRQADCLELKVNLNHIVGPYLKHTNKEASGFISSLISGHAEPWGNSLSGPMGPRRYQFPWNAPSGRHSFLIPDSTTGSKPVLKTDTVGAGSCSPCHQCDLRIWGQDAWTPSDAFRALCRFRSVLSEGVAVFHPEVLRVQEL